MDAGGTTSASRLPDMLTARVPSGFGDQVRAAARTRGERPGEFIRRAIRDRIDGEGGAPAAAAERPPLDLSRLGVGAGGVAVYGVGQ